MKKKVGFGLVGLFVLFIIIGATNNTSTSNSTRLTSTQTTSQSSNSSSSKSKPVSNSAQQSTPSNSDPTSSNTSTSQPTTTAPTPTYTSPAQTTPTNCTNGTYVNSYGNTVCSPETATTAPAGATAQCVDGTYSFSQTRSGTCSHHGGVATWLY